MIPYHRKLRDKSLTKSQLDEIYGVGEAKKKLLLKKFGSIEKIKSASEDDIASLKGIDIELARRIKDNLD